MVASMKTQWTSPQNPNQLANKKTPTAKLLILSAILWAVFFAASVSTAQTNPLLTDYASDRILVKPRPGADLTALNTTLGTIVIRSFPGIGNLEVVQLPQNASVTNFLALFQQSG